MSVGPAEKKEGFGTSTVEKVSVSTKVLITGYFKDPLYYIFYASLSGIIVGLFCHIIFSVDLYLIVGVCGVIRAIKGKYEKPPKENK